MDPRRKREFIADGESITFQRGQEYRVVDADRADVLLAHPRLEAVEPVDLPEDYRVLQQMAAAVDDDAIDGNAPKAEIVAYLEQLPADEIETLRP